MKLKKFVPFLTVLLLSLVIWIADLHHYFSLEVLKSHQGSLEQFIKNNLILSVLIYGITYAVVILLSLPVATFMTFTGGFLFGQWVGTSVVVIFATIGACLFFLSARMASSNLIGEKLGSLAIKMQKGFQEDALFYLFTLRLIPLFPFFAVNLAAALFQIPLKVFVFGTFFGIIPGTFVYVSMGVALREIIQKPNFSKSVVLDPKVLLALTGFGILSILPVLYKYVKSR